MDCPRCKKSNTCVLVTSQPPKKTRDRRGVLLWILLFPFMLIRWIWRVLIIGTRKTNFQKKQEWRCNYCNHTFPQTFED